MGRISNEKLQLIYQDIANGLVDTEGYFYPSQRIEVTITSEKLANNLFDAYLLLGFSPVTWNRKVNRGNRKQTYSVVIKKKDFQKYLCEIGSSNPHKLRYAPVV